MPPAVSTDKVLRHSLLLQTAHDLADAAAGKILPQFRKVRAVENKDQGTGFDPVTAADKAAERAMRALLQQRFPNHAIVGEEYAALETASRYRWVLDPIDGTRAFISGLPLWGTLIGLLDGQAPVLGMMDQPYMRERFWAVGGKSRMRLPDGRTRSLATRACPSLKDAVMMSTSPDLFQGREEREAFARLKDDVRMTRFGGDCYGYCMLAAGHIDLIVEAGLKAVDIVALIPIIEQAGGVVTTWTGEPAIAGGRILAAGDKRLHATAMKRLAG